MAITPNYEDERLDKVEADKNQAINESNQTYDGMIKETGEFFDKKAQEIEDWESIQAQTQQDRTDFTIEKIEQQREQAQKDYTKERSDAYADWQKQSNRYGVEAERMAEVGLKGSGYSESAQVSMYNTYQNRLVAAKESYDKAVLNYDNAIKDAQLQNDAVLAQLALETLQKQFELSIQGFQQQNELVLAKANKKTELDNIYYGRYQDVLQRIDNEKALAEEIRQKELERQHELAKIDKQLENDKELLKYQQELAKLGITPITGSNNTTSAYEQAQQEKFSQMRAGNNNYPKIYLNGKEVSTYEEAVTVIEQHNPDADVSSLLTRDNWQRRRNAYLSTGQGVNAVKYFDSYEKYLSSYILAIRGEA